jgi:hypothetical protein
VFFDTTQEEASFKAAEPCLLAQEKADRPSAHSVAG